MAVPYPFMSSVYLPNPIRLGNGSGLNGVEFTQFSEPPEIPEFIRKRRVVLSEMWPAGLGLPGTRVVEAYRTDVNHYDTPVITFNLVTPAQLARIRSYVEPLDEEDDNPGWVTVYLGEPGGSTYLGVMGEDYPRVTNYRYNGRVCHKVEVMIHILGTFSGSISL